MSNFAKNTPDHKNAKKALNTSQARAKKLTGEKNTAENDLRNIRSNIERFVATLETLEEFMDSEYESNDKLKAAQLEFEESEKRHAEAKAEADSAQDERRQYDKAVKDADKQIKNASRSAEKHTKKLTKAQSNQEKARLLTKVQKKRTEAAYWKVDEAAYRREVKECNKMRDERADLIDQVDQDTAAVETKRNALPYELGEAERQLALAYAKVNGPQNRHNHDAYGHPPPTGLQAIVQWYESQNRQLEQAFGKRDAAAIQAKIKKRVEDLKEEMNTVPTLREKIAMEVAKHCRIKCTHGNAMARQGSGLELESDLDRQAAIKRCKLCDDLGYCAAEPGKGPSEQTPLDGDFLVWRKDRKANAFQIFVYDVRYKDQLEPYQEVVLEIDDKQGRLVQRGTRDEHGQPRVVSQTLAAAISNRREDNSVDKIWYTDPDSTRGERHEVRLQRQVFVGFDDLARVQDDVYPAVHMYIGLFVFEFYDWMTDWGFFAINANGDKTFECGVEAQGNDNFDYKSYVRAVLFFNVLGTLIVFPVEIAMATVRLIATRDMSSRLENYVSAGMLITLVLEDIPQLIVQAVYFVVSGKEFGFTSGFSTLCTSTGVIVGIYVSRRFIYNFVVYYILGEEGKLLQERKGDFQREMWKLGIIVLILFQFFDFVSSWTFFAQVVVTDSLQRDIEASGGHYNDYRNTYIVVCTLQTVFVLPARISLCVSQYSRQDRLEAKREQKKKADIAAGRTSKPGLSPTEGDDDAEDQNVNEQGQDEEDDPGTIASKPASLVFGVEQFFTAFLVDFPELFLQIVYLTVVGTAPSSVGFQSVSVFTLLFVCFNLLAAAKLISRYVWVMLGVLLRWDKKASPSWVMWLATYRSKLWKLGLALFGVFVFATFIANWSFYGTQCFKTGFELAWEYDVQGDRNINTTFRLPVLLCCIVGTFVAGFQIYKVALMLFQMQPGNGIRHKAALIQSRAEREKFKKQVAEQDVDDGTSEGYDTERVIDLQFGLAGVVGLILVNGPMLLLQITYYQTMLHTQVKPLDRPYAYCLYNEYDDFAECATREYNAVHALNDAEMKAKTLGPSGAMVTHLGLSATMLAAGFLFLWGLVTEWLKRREKKPAVLELLSWPPGFAVFLVEVLGLMSRWLFYENSISSEVGRETFAQHSDAKVLVDYEQYRKALLAFNVIASTLVPGSLLVVGLRYVSNSEFKNLTSKREVVKNDKQQLEKESEKLSKLQQQAEAKQAAAAGQRKSNPGAQDVTSDEYNEEGGYGFIEVELDDQNRIVQDMQNRIRNAEIDIEKVSQTPKEVALVFVGVASLSISPLLSLMGIYVTYAPSDGTAVFAMIVTAIAGLIAAKVVGGWLAAQHPLLCLLSALELTSIIACIVAFATELYPYASNELRWTFLAFMLVHIIAVVPFLFGATWWNLGAVTKRVREREQEELSQEIQASEGVSDADAADAVTGKAGQSIVRKKRNWLTELVDNQRTLTLNMDELVAGEGKKRVQHKISQFDTEVYEPSDLNPTPVVDSFEKRLYALRAGNIMEAGLEGLLQSDGMYTVFVPTEEAFEVLYKLEEQGSIAPDKLNDALLLHIVPYDQLKLEDFEDVMTLETLGGTLIVSKPLNGGLTLTAPGSKKAVTVESTVDDLTPHCARHTIGDVLFPNAEAVSIFRTAKIHWPTIMSFWADLMIKGLPQVVMLATFVAYNPGSKSRATRWALTCAVAVLLENLVVIFTWALQEGLALAWLLALHICCLFGTWLSFGICTVRVGTTEQIVVSAVCAAVGTFVFVPAQLFYGWKYIHDPVSGGKDAASRVGIKLFIKSPRMVWLIGAAAVGWLFPLLLLQVIVLAQHHKDDDGNFDIATSAITLLVTLCGFGSTAFLCFRWLYEQHVMLMVLTLQQTLVVFFFMLFVGVAVGEADDGGPFEAIAIAFFVCALAVTPGQIYAFWHQLSNVTSTSRFLLINAKLYSQTKTVIAPPTVVKEEDKAWEDLAALAQDLSSKSKDDPGESGGTCSNAVGSFLSKCKLRAIELTDNELSGVSGRRMVLCSFGLDILVKFSPQFVLVCLYFTHYADNIDACSGGQLLANAVTALFLITILISGISYASLLGWTVYNIHATLLPYGVLEIVDCISNWTLLATVGSTSSMLLAVVAFNVVSTILLGYQLGTLYWHFHLGLNSPGKVLDVPRTDSNEWFYRLTDLAKRDGIPPKIVAVLGIAPLTLRHIPFLVLVSFALVDGNDPAVCSFVLLGTLASGAIALAIVIKRVQEGIRDIRGSQLDLPKKKRPDRDDRRAGSKIGKLAAPGIGQTLDRRRVMDDEDVDGDYYDPVANPVPEPDVDEYYDPVANPVPESDKDLNASMANPAPEPPEPTRPKEIIRKKTSWQGIPTVGEKELFEEGEFAGFPAELETGSKYDQLPEPKSAHPYGEEFSPDGFGDSDDFSESGGGFRLRAILIPKGAVELKRCVGGAYIDMLITNRINCIGSTGSVTGADEETFAGFGEDDMSDPLWLHGEIDRKAATQLLHDAGNIPGQFLVRRKTDEQGAMSYAMTVVGAKRVVHRLIEENTDGSYTVDKKAGEWGANLDAVVAALTIEYGNVHGLTLAAVQREQGIATAFPGKIKGRVDAKATQKRSIQHKPTTYFDGDMKTYVDYIEVDAPEEDAYGFADSSNSDDYE